MTHRLIALTGSADDERADIFDAYLLKPTEPEALRRALEGAVKAGP